MASDSTGSLVPRHPTAQRLLDAAIHSMDTDGEAGLRVDAVVAEAGVTIPVLYHHFGSREGLVRAAHTTRLHRALGQMLDDSAEAIAEVTDRAGLMAMFDGVIESVAAPSHDRFIRMNVLGATYGRPDLQEEVAALQRDTWVRMAEMLEEPQRKGWINPDVDLVMFVGWMFGLFFGRILFDIQPDGDEVSPWADYTRRAVWAVLWGEAPPS